MRLSTSQARHRKAQHMYRNSNDEAVEFCFNQRVIGKPCAHRPFHSCARFPADRQRLLLHDETGSSICETIRRCPALLRFPKDRGGCRRWTLEIEHEILQRLPSVSLQSSQHSSSTVARVQTSMACLRIDLVIGYIMTRLLSVSIFKRMHEANGRWTRRDGRCPRSSSKRDVEQSLARTIAGNHRCHVLPLCLRRLAGTHLHE